ncbi:MAG: glycosyltransferase family 2 protein [Thermoanaerobaculia bacterium]|nr:glycosyltransferase family 2 protein [Thermoanaerobaculia bacterium]
MNGPSQRGSLPRISIVTPSLNQGAFLRQAIESVLSQDYPHLEYLVMDGGSTDGSLDVLRSFGDRLQWVSEPDGGQAEALNRGFRRSRGDVLAWLNADDVLEPGALGAVARAFAANPEVGLVYGQGRRIDASGDVLGPFTGIEPFRHWRLLHFLDFVLQPAAFFRAEAFACAGPLDESLHWSLDWDLWIRLAAVTEVLFLDRVLASAREHDAAKTSTGGWPRVRELYRLARRHTGTGWTPGVRCYALDTLRRRAPRGLAAATGLAVDLATRRISTSLAAYADGWLGPEGRIVVPRRWGGAVLELQVPRLPRRAPLVLRISPSAGHWEEIRITETGELRHVVTFSERGRGPLVEIRIDSSFSFRTPGDRRRLSVRCTGIHPWRQPA